MLLPVVFFSVLVTLLRREPASPDGLSFVSCIPGSWEMTDVERKHIR